MAVAAVQSTPLRCAALLLTVLAAPVAAELRELAPLVEAFHGKGAYPWLARLRVPELEPGARAVYGGPEDDTGRAFARWVAAMQAGDRDAAKRAWTELSREGWRARLAAHLRRAWPHAGWADGERERAFACLDAIARVGGDDFHRAFAARRRAYVEACTKEIPDPPAEDLPESRRARVWIEGLRRMGPLWSCIAGTPPRFHGEPDAHLALRQLSPSAYPDLVIACFDPRPAGRSMSVGGRGERATVSFLAKSILRRHLHAEEEEDVLERWIQSGTWKDPDESRAWFIENGRSAHTVVFRILEKPALAERFLDHDDESVRVAAAAANDELDGLRKNRPSRIRGFRPWRRTRFDPHTAAIRAWTLVAIRHGAAGRALLGEELQGADDNVRLTLLDSVAYADVDRKLVSVCSPWVTRGDDALLRALAAWAVWTHSGKAFEVDGIRVTEAAQRWLEDRQR